jgi:SAM-dependent methyltransferase
MSDMTEGHGPAPYAGPGHREGPGGATRSSVDDRERLARLADGYVVTQLLHVAISLGVPEALAAGPRRIDDLAREVGAVPELLWRVARGLAAEAVLEELTDGRFALTAMGELLRAGTPGSLRGTVAARGELYYGAGAGLLEAVHRGGTPFERVHGRPFFDHLAGDPDRLAAFSASMAGRSAHEAAAVVAAYDVSRWRSVVDVGGGTGALLRAIRDRAPGADLVLLDRPEVVAGSGLPAVAGDFFEAVPAGADAYLLSRVLHDWDDRDALRILRTCQAAMRPDSVLVIVEAILPERAVDDPAAVRMDLHMLVLLGGRERTMTEYDVLLEAAALRRAAQVRTDAGVQVLEARCAGG